MSHYHLRLYVLDVKGCVSENGKRLLHYEMANINNLLSPEYNLKTLWYLPERDTYLLCANEMTCGLTYLDILLNRGKSLEKLRH